MLLARPVHTQGLLPALSSWALQREGGGARAQVRRQREAGLRSMAGWAAVQVEALAVAEWQRPVGLPTGPAKRKAEARGGCPRRSAGWAPRGHRVPDLAQNSLGATPGEAGAPVLHREWRSTSPREGGAVRKPDGNGECPLREWTARLDGKTQAASELSQTMPARAAEGPRPVVQTQRPHQRTTTESAVER